MSTFLQMLTPNLLNFVFYMMSIQFHTSGYIYSEVSYVIICILSCQAFVEMVIPGYQPFNTDFFTQSVISTCLRYCKTTNGKHSEKTCC